LEEAKVMFFLALNSELYEYIKHVHRAV